MDENIKINYYSIILFFRQNLKGDNAIFGGFGMTI